MARGQGEYPRHFPKLEQVCVEYHTGVVHSTASEIQLNAHYPMDVQTWQATPTYTDPVQYMSHQLIIVATTPLLSMRRDKGLAVVANIRKWGGENPHVF